jgi:hypothetical protein
MRLTFDPRFRLGLAWSRDGSRLAYGIANPGRRFQLAVKTVDGAAPEQVILEDRRVHGFRTTGPLTTAFSYVQRWRTEGTCG